MTEIECLSPVQIVDSKILALHLDIPTEPNELDKTVAYSLTASLNDPEVHDDKLTCWGRVEVSYDAICDDENETPAYSMSCIVGMTIAISRNAIIDMDDDARKEYVNANLVSLCYGKARSIIEGITAESAIGKKTIPAIDPYSFIRSSDARAKENN